MSLALCVSLPAAGPAPATAADNDAIINSDDWCCVCDAASPPAAAAAGGGLQYLYWFFMCCENEPEWLNVLRQCSQRNGFSPLCRRPCSVRWCLCLNALSQTGQTNGRWPDNQHNTHWFTSLHFISTRISYKTGLDVLMPEQPINWSRLMKIRTIQLQDRYDSWHVQLWHSVERMPQPRPLILQNCSC